MFVRTIKRKTISNVAVQIVKSYRNAQGLPRQKIIRHIGSYPEGEMLEKLIHIAYVEKICLEDKI